MRRTISTLMFLAACGVISAAHAADNRESNSGYYAAGSSIRISDDDGAAETSPAAAAPATQAAASAAATRSAVVASRDQNALYVSNTSAGSNTGLLQTNYWDGGCGCSPTNSACDDGYGCGCYVNAFRLEYLGWFSRGRNAPVLVTTGPNAANNTATNVYPVDPIGTDIRQGGRISLSHLLADGITYIDGRFWGVEDSSQAFNVTTANNPILAVPFRNANLNNAPDAIAIGAPGGVSVLSKNDLIGADVWGRRNWYSDCCSRLDFIGGYQFTRLDDSMLITVNDTVAPGATVTTVDSFRTQNEFHAASLGFLAEQRRGVWSFEALGKIAFGNMRQAVIINGQHSTNGGAASPGGFFAQSTNSGSFQRNRFAIAPEVNLNLIYNFSPQLRLIGGYTFIYWSNVVLAGNQIDTTINPTLLPFAGGPPVIPPNRPALLFQRTDYWVQGLSMGAEYRW